MDPLQYFATEMKGAAGEKTDFVKILNTGV